MNVSILIYPRSGNVAIACFTPDQTVTTALLPLETYVRDSNTFLRELYQVYKLKDYSISEIKFKTEVSRAIYHYIEKHLDIKAMYTEIKNKIKGG